MEVHQRPTHRLVFDVCGVIEGFLDVEDVEDG